MAKSHHESHEGGSAPLCTQGELNTKAARIELPRECHATEDRQCHALFYGPDDVFMCVTQTGSIMTPRMTPSSSLARATSSSSAYSSISTPDQVNSMPPPGESDTHVDSALPTSYASEVETEIPLAMLEKKSEEPSVSRKDNDDVSATTASVLANAQSSTANVARAALRFMIRAPKGPPAGREAQLVQQQSSTQA